MNSIKNHLYSVHLTTNKSDVNPDHHTISNELNHQQIYHNSYIIIQKKYDRNHPKTLMIGFD